MILWYTVSSVFAPLQKALIYNRKWGVSSFMDSINEVMEAVKAFCKEKTSDATYAFYIKDIKAVSFENSKTVTLELRSDFVMGIVSDRYTALLQDAFKAILGFDVEIRYVVAPPEDGVKPGDSENQMDEKSLPSGRYEFTFENFIKGPSNQFAFAAAQAVAANPSGAYNPLFIYGPSGLGKTHLLNAIKIEIQKNHPDFNIVYVDCEKFTNETITAIKTATMEQFRQRYRKADVLLIDDIQFLAGKESTQEEFFHTFNCLYEAGKQIVVTSDRPPKEMKRLNDRLCSRLEGGLLADVQPPDLETRTAIIRTKAAQFGMVLSEEVVQYIAENITSNVRQLEGVVKRLTAYRDILDDTITVDSVKRAIKDVIRTGTYIPTPDVIIEESARSFQLSGADLRGQSRNKKTAMARQIAMYLMRNLTNLPLKEIGEEFGGRNHATVLSSIRKVEELLKSDPDISATVRDITSNINSKN